MRVGIFNTAFVGDVALMGQLIDGLHTARHDVVLISNAAGCSLFQFDTRVYEVAKVKKEKGTSKVASVFKIGRQIRALKLDVLLVAHSSFTTGLCAALSGVRKIYSFSGSAVSHFPFEKVDRLNSAMSRVAIWSCAEIWWTQKALHRLVLISKVISV